MGCTGAFGVNLAAARTVWGLEGRGGRGVLLEFVASGWGWKNTWEEKREKV